MVNLIGFNGPMPYSVIIWNEGGEGKAKTICYSLEDQIAALQRFHTNGDFYNTFDSAVVIGENDEVRIWESFTKKSS
jgi:hypothetical protein